MAKIVNSNSPSIEVRGTMEGAGPPFSSPRPFGTYSSPLAPARYKSIPGASRAYYRKRMEGPLGKYWIKHSSILNQKNKAEERAHAQDAWYGVYFFSLTLLFHGLPVWPRKDRSIISHWCKCLVPLLCSTWTQLTPLVGLPMRSATWPWIPLSS
jgi:hypothetical protein